MRGIGELILFILLIPYTRRMRHGFLLIDKPPGPTSHDVVDRVRSVLGESKVGHLGTLDPAASGLLVLAVGAKALKVIEFFTDLSKEYEAEVRCGAVSTTYDREGVIEDVAPKSGWSPPDLPQLQRLLTDRFLGKIMQAPPAHSAVNIAGERAYRRARRGESVRPPLREVEIASCSVLAYAYPRLRLLIGCSSGTYIRSLAHDLGQVLRCGAYLENLRRTQVGEWDIVDACPPGDASWARVLPLKNILKPFRGIELTAGEAEDLQFGRPIQREVKPDTFAWFQDLPIAILTPAKDGSRMAQPRKVL